MRSISMTLSLVGLLALGGCAAVPDELKDPDTFVSVELREGQITLSRNILTMPGDDVEFSVTNFGTVVHDFMIVATDLPAADLPTNPDGSYMEDGPGTVMRDVERGIQPGNTADLNTNMYPGHYVALCNRVDIAADGSPHSHYAHGMFVDIDVTTEPVP